MPESAGTTERARPGRWTPIPALNRLLALARPTKRPSVFVVSFPRSGSTWVGAVLGKARNALYLREPMTQGDAERDFKPVFELDRGNPPKSWASAAGAAFTGAPVFHDGIARFPSQWKLGERRRRRIVVKEVNPFAIRWVWERWKPRIVFLVRHPVAVTASFVKRGWGGSFDTPAAWRDHAALQARAQRAALDVFQYQSNVERRIVVYEELCADPLGEFKKLCEFTDLAFDAELEAYIREHDAEKEGERDRPFSIYRDSKAMIASWKSAAKPEEIAAAREGYASVSLPFYRTDADW